MNREDVLRMSREAYRSEDSYLLYLERFAALVAAEKDAEIKRLQDLLYTQLGELTAQRAEKRMRGLINELKETTLDVSADLHDRITEALQEPPR